MAFTIRDFKVQARMATALGVVAIVGGGAAWWTTPRR